MEPNTTTGTGTQASATSPTAWIDAYTAWASRRSPLTPPHFHEGIAYSLAACAIAGRICIQGGQGRIYPNLYTLLLGKTAVYAKSVAMDLSQEVAERAMIENRIIYSVFTPESIVGELAGEKPTNLDKLTQDLQNRWKESARWGSRRMLRLDEAGMFFNSLQRDYNAGFIDLWMKLYDGPATFERTTYKHGLHVIQQPVLSCLFATTPASIGHLLRKQEMWLNGFWPRWNFCVGGGYPEFTPSAFEEPPTDVWKPLFELGNNRLGRWEADNPLKAKITPEVTKDYEAVLEANRKRIFENPDGYMEAVLGRLHTKRLKLALILASLAEPEAEKITITNDFWEATKKPVQQMELDMVEALQQTKRTDKAEMEERVILWLMRQPSRKGTLRQLIRHMGLAHAEIDPIVTTLKNGAVIDMRRDGNSMKIELLTPT